MGLAAGSAGASEHDAVESNGCNAQQDKDSANSCSGVDDHKKDGDKVADANGCGGPNGCGAEK